MSDIHNQSDITFLENIGDRYSILSEESEFKSFKGLLKAQSSDLYEYEGNLYTGGHKIILDGFEYEIRHLRKANKVDATETVYEPLEVADTHTYMSNGFINKNCTTGESIVHIKDNKTDEMHDVTLDELETIIDLDNAGIDFSLPLKTI